MAIKVNGTTVINDSRALSNIASVDATSAAAMSAAGVGSAPTVSAAGLRPQLMVPDGYGNSHDYSPDGHFWRYYGAAQSGDTISIAAKDHGNYSGATKYYYNFTSSDNGVTWTKTQFGSSNELRSDIDTDGNGNWVQVFYTGACRRSTNNAVTWTTGGSATVNEGERVVYVGNNSWLTFSNGGNTAKRSTDVGANWSNVSTGMGGVNIKGVAHDGAGTVIAVGIYGTNQMSRSTNYGTTWSAFTLSNLTTPHAIGTDGNGNWVITPEGSTSEHYYYSTNNGASWASKGTFNHNDFGMIQPGFKGDIAYSDRSGFIAGDGDGRWWNCASSSSLPGGFLTWTNIQAEIKNLISSKEGKYVKKATDRESFWTTYQTGQPPAFFKA
jgi:hypothetical protein